MPKTPFQEEEYFFKKKVREMAVYLLRLAKTTRTYRTLGEILGLQQTVLARYVKGEVVPSYERAVKMSKRLSQVVNLQNTLAELTLLKDGFFDNSKIIGNPSILKLAAYECMKRFKDYRITKILTPAVDGIPIAVACAIELNKPLVIAKKAKEVGVENFIEYSYTTEDGVVISWYIPKTLFPRDSILIVDDVVRRGDTLKAMMQLVRLTEANLTGIFTLVTIGEDYKQVVGDVKYETVLTCTPTIEKRTYI